MASIFGDGGIRRAPEPTSGPPADALARAGELARRLAAIVDEGNTEGPLEAARLLVEVRRLTPQAQEGFLAAAAEKAAPEARAETLRERIARAYPEGSERRRKLGAAFVSLEGGEPGAVSASLLEAKVTSALRKLGAVSTPARSVHADSMEKARGFGLFGANPAPSASALAPSTGPEVATSWRAEDLAQQTATMASTTGTDGRGEVPAAWQPVLSRALEIAPGLTGGIVSIGRAANAITAVKQGLGQIGEGKGIWARARAAASMDATGRIAARLEGMRDRLGGGLEAAARRPALPRLENLASVARELRGEAVEVRQEIGRAQELLPDIELVQAGSAQAALGSAEEHMQAAEYGLQAYATQQDLVSSQVPGPEDSSADAPVGEDSSPALTPEMITPEVIEQLRASGQVPPEMIAQLEAGEVTPELLAQLQGQGGARISRAELESIGTEISPPPAQGFWNIGTVGTGMDRAIFDGDDYARKAAEATNRTLSEPTVRPIDGAELAAAIRDMGVPLSRVDPSQLQSAVDYINNGSAGAVEEFGRGAPKSVDEQRERMALALRQTRYLVEHGAAPIDRQTAINLCWSAARIPGHAFEGMSDDEARAVAQQTAAACNTPGNHEFKVGKHTVKLTIAESGAVKSTSTKPPSAWGRIGRIANVVLTVATFMPPPVGVVARCVQTGIALVNAIRNGGSFLDIVAAGASFVGAGGAAIGSVVGSAARVAGTVARVANAVSGVARGVQGVQRGGVGGVLSGLGGIAGGIAGGMQVAGGSAGASSALSTAGRVLGQAGAAVGAAENYIHANRAVGQAREAVQQARATGDPAKIQRAEQQLAEAERGKRSAILGGLATAGQVAANTLSRNTQGQTDARTSEVPAEGRSAFQVGAEIFSRGMSAARGINERDYLTAGVEAFGAAAAARQGTKPIKQEDVIRDGRRIPVLGPDGKPMFLQRDDFNLLNQASSVLDGLNDWRGAERSEGQARDAVGQAKDFLDRAMASGDPEAIRDAETGLRRARQGLVHAELGSSFALDNAAERFTGAVDTFQNSRAADRFHVEERFEQTLIEKTRKTTSGLATNLGEILREEGGTSTQQEWAVSQLLALAQADQAYQNALLTGEPALIREAREALEGVQQEIARLPPPLARVASLGVADVPRVLQVGRSEGTQPDPKPGATFFAGPIEDFGLMAEKVAQGYEPRDPSTGLLLSPEQLLDLAKRDLTSAQRSAANKEGAESRLDRLDSLLAEGLSQYAEISIPDSAFRDGRLDTERILAALEGRVGQYASLELPQLREALGDTLRDAKPGDVLDISELYSVAYQTSRGRAQSVAESIGEPGSIRYWSAIIGQADYAPPDLVHEAELALGGQVVDDIGLALGAYALGRGAAYVGRALVRKHFAAPPRGVMQSPVNRGVGTGNPVGYVTDLYADYRLRAVQRQVTAQVDAAIRAGDGASLARLGGKPGEVLGALRGEATFRGTIIDVASKKSASNTFDLQWLKYSERGRFGPDVWNPWTMRAWDITTTGQWRRHVMKYVVKPKPARPVWRTLSPLLTK